VGPDRSDLPHSVQHSLSDLSNSVPQFPFWDSLDWGGGHTPTAAGACRVWDVVNVEAASGPGVSAAQRVLVGPADPTAGNVGAKGRSVLLHELRG